MKETIAEWTTALQLLDTKIDFYGEWLASGRRPNELPSVRTVKKPSRKDAS